MSGIAGLTYTISLTMKLREIDGGTGGKMVSLLSDWILPAEVLPLVCSAPLLVWSRAIPLV